MQMIEHPDLDSLSTTVARTLAQICAEAIATRGTAVLALAGGSTPLPVYRHLAGIELDWSRVVLLPGDERWVAHDEPACNLRAMREAFAAANASFRPLTPELPEGPPDTSVADATLADLQAPFDACVLGMGGDGHFASLFPDAEGLTEALDPETDKQAVVVRPSPFPADAPFERISLTLSRIASSRRLLLLIRGEDKRRVLHNARTSADSQRYPIAALMQHAGDALEIHWSP
ncbi:MAG TPA: 6-phosphogluconolactonase [Wenzhouxiangellaceae bacterium]|nr:6-phosphogluconolactonase [Wenzhouxiangellaceae bacterium]